MMKNHLFRKPVQRNLVCRHIVLDLNTVRSHYNLELHNPSRKHRTQPLSSLRHSDIRLAQSVHARCKVRGKHLL